MEKGGALGAYAPGGTRVYARPATLSSWRLDVTAETLEPLEDVKETTPLHPVFVADMFMAILHEITRRQLAVAKCEQ